MHFGEECIFKLLNVFYFYMQGYYDFSQKLKRIARLPFATIACGENHQQIYVTL
jgi:hypothetical protein